MISILFKQIVKNCLFTILKFIRFFTYSFDNEISLYLSKLNWSSKIYNKSLEITTTVGCAMMCAYCPQENYKKNGKSYPRVLTFPIFKKALDNVNRDVKIHWTGFSEPLHCEEFSKMSDYAHTKGHVQHISTTMYGRKNSKDYISSSDKFDSIVFHLPDKDKLMNLKVNDEYIDYLEKTIRFQSRKIKTKKFLIMVIGEDFEEKVKILLKKLIIEKVISETQVEIRKHLVSRAGQIEKREGFRQNKIEKFDQNKKNLFYCGYGRLNKSVMLTDGSLAICCNDYSIEHNVGSLVDESLDQLYKHKKLFSDDEFISGNKKLCKKCEFYKFI